MDDKDARVLQKPPESSERNQPSAVNMIELSSDSAGAGGLTADGHPATEIIRNP